MRFVRPPFLAQVIYPNVTWRLSKTEKTIYLTFDDGPEPTVTPWVLDTLKAFNACATFFCLGKNVNAYPEVYNRILREGHAVGNHTYSHLKGWKTSNSVYLEDVKKCAEVVSSRLFRPPYGKMKFSQYSGLNTQYSIIMWDVLSYDYDQSLAPEKCLQQVIKYSRPGSIVVLHDSLKAQKNLLYLLPRALEHFHTKGFLFKAIF